jgi:hypothetical protein
VGSSRSIRLIYFLTYCSLSKRRASKTGLRDSQLAKTWEAGGYFGVSKATETFSTSVTPYCRIILLSSVPVFMALCENVSKTIEKKD